MNNPYVNTNIDKTQLKSNIPSYTNLNHDKLLNTQLPINNSSTLVSNSVVDKSNLNVNTFNNLNPSFNQSQNTILDKSQFNANINNNKNLSVNQFSNPANNIETKSQDAYNSSNKLGYEGFGPSHNKSGYSDQNKQNIQNFNSSDVVKVQNSNPQLSKSPHLSSNNIHHVKVNESVNKSFERIEQNPNKNDIKFEFEDNSNKAPNTNYAIKKPEPIPNKSGFDFGFSMEIKNDNNQLEQSKSAFDMGLGKTDQINFEPPKSGFDMNFDNKKPIENNTNDFGMYPTFEKKPESKKFNDGFDDFGNFGDDFGNFESDFKKAQKEKDFFNDNNWGDFK